MPAEATSSTPGATDDSVAPRRPRADAPTRTRSSGSAGLLVVLALGALAGAFLLDDTVIGCAAEHQAPGWARLARVVNQVLDWPLVILGTGLAAAALHLLRKKEPARLLGSIFLGALLCGLVATSLRSVIGRTRPGAAVEQGWYGPRAHGQWVIGRYAYAAFPSGHTATVAGAAGVLLLARRSAGLAACSLIGLVGWARIYVGAHRLSDVTAAALLGLFGGALIWQWRSRRYTPPDAGRGG